MRNIHWLLLIVLANMLLGCGGSGNGNSPDDEPSTDSRELTITAAGVLNDATESVAYSDVLQATGGVTPYTWSISSGALPANITLNPATGELSGIPPVGSAGTANFEITVTDSAGDTDRHDFELTVVAAPLVIPEPLVITTATLPSGVENQAYLQTLQASGGNTPYLWSIASGTLPNGLSLDPSSGELAGIPNIGSAGTTTVVIRVEDDSGTTAEHSYDMLIEALPAPPLAITTTTLPTAVENTAYSHTLQASGGVEPYTWMEVTGNLPDGMLLEADTGELAGTPAIGSTGTANLTVRVEDSAGSIAEQHYDLVVDTASEPEPEPEPFSILWKNMCGTNTEIDNSCLLRRNSGGIDKVRKAFEVGNDFVYNFGILPFEEQTVGDSDDGGREVIIDYEGYMERVLADGGAEVESKARQLGQELLALEQTYGRKVYVQLGNEISATVAEGGIKIEELCQWATDPHIEDCWLEPYVRYALWPFAKGLRSAGISVSPGSISGLRSEGHRNQIYAMLDTQVEPDIIMHELLDTTTGHYMIGVGPEIDGPAFLDEMMANTVLSNKVNTHIQTEEVGDNLAEGGKGGSSLLRVLMRTMTYALTHELDQRTLRFLAFGANTQVLEENKTIYAGTGEKIAEGTGLDAIELLDATIGDNPVTLADIASQTEAHAFAHDQSRYALLVYQKPNNTSSPEEIFVSNAQLDCPIKALQSYYIGDEGLILFTTASVTDDTVILNHNIEHGEAIFLHAECR